MRKGIGGMLSGIKEETEGMLLVEKRINFGQSNRNEESNWGHAIWYKRKKMGARYQG
jgi:hypothetical protein